MYPASVMVQQGLGSHKHSLLSHGALWSGASPGPRKVLPNPTQ